MFFTAASRYSNWLSHRLLFIYEQMANAGENTLWRVVADNVAGISADNKTFWFHLNLLVDTNTSLYLLLAQFVKSFIVIIQFEAYFSWLFRTPAFFLRLFVHLFSFSIRIESWISFLFAFFWTSFFLNYFFRWARGLLLN